MNKFEAAEFFHLEICAWWSSSIFLHVGRFFFATTIFQSRWPSSNICCSLSLAFLLFCLQCQITPQSLKPDSFMPDYSNSLERLNEFCFRNKLSFYAIMLHTASSRTLIRQFHRHLFRLINDTMDFKSITLAQFLWFRCETWKGSMQIFRRF